MPPVPPPYHVVWKIELVAEGADDSWLEKNPGYDGAHACLFVPIYWSPDDPKTAIISLAGVDGRTGEAPSALVLEQVWRALMLHLRERDDVPENRRALYRRVEEMAVADGRKEKRKRERAERGSLLDERQRAEVLDRLKPLFAEAVARASRLHVPLAEYCVLLPMKPAAGEPEGLVLTRAEAREYLPPEQDTFGVVPELEEPRPANEMLAFVVCEGGLEVVSVEVTSITGPDMPSN
jgi:hypothetical protein